MGAGPITGSLERGIRHATGSRFANDGHLDPTERQDRIVVLNWVLAICDYAREREAKRAAWPDPGVYEELNTLEARATAELGDLLRDQVRVSQKAGARSTGRPA